MAKVFDPVCKMTIEDSGAVAQSVYEDQTIYFCAMGCKKAFDKTPEKFMEVWREHAYSA